PHRLKAPRGSSPADEVIAMRISQLMKEGLQIAREQRSLWLFGFFVGAAAANQGGGGGGGDGAPGGVTGPGGDPGLGVLFLIVMLVILLVAGVVMYFISLGALMEGVARLRRGAKPSVR